MDELQVEGNRFAETFTDIICRVLKQYTIYSQTATKWINWFVLIHNMVKFVTVWLNLKLLKYVHLKLELPCWQQNITCNATCGAILVKFNIKYQRQYYY